MVTSGVFPWRKRGRAPGDWASARPRCASLVVVEFAILANEEDASARRDALGYLGLAARLEVTGSNRQGHITAGRLLIDHDARSCLSAPQLTDQSVEGKPRENAAATTGRTAI